MTQDKFARYKEIANSDLCLEEKLGQHFAVYFDGDAPFMFVELAFGLIWAFDSGSKQLDEPLKMPINGSDGQRMVTLREQMYDYGLEFYLGRSLVPVRPEFDTDEWIRTCNASLPQKLKWHFMQKEYRAPLHTVAPALQAIWLDAYGFDWNSTFVTLPEGMFYYGMHVAPLGKMIEGHSLEHFLLETEDNQARWSAGTVGAASNRQDAGRALRVDDNQ
jgi:hypothetical protein